jgi:2-keto-4-pentenoate hydratase/2-oxohepta-3-ene-1,7-dioic acid hydratase in catechol pathway
MQLAVFSDGGPPRIGLVLREGVVDIARRLSDAPDNMIELIQRWPALQPRLEAALRAGADLDIANLKLYAPVARPRKIFAIGLNYSDHCAEFGLDIPTEQIWFSKAVTAVNGPFSPIDLPAVSEELDYECEMVAVIGKRCRNVPRHRAAEVIFGYCVGNDVSVRDWQSRTSQWVLGKSFDTHAPIGPWITTADEVDPQALDMCCYVNGEGRQKTNTRYMVFDCYAQIECITKAVTLEPGDLVFTGTCGGVGASSTPPRWLRAGDVVRVEIGGLGAIENPVRAAQFTTIIE